MHPHLGQAVGSFESMGRINKSTVYFLESDPKNIRNALKHNALPISSSLFCLYGGNMIQMEIIKYLMLMIKYAKIMIHYHHTFA